jgi:hypothetical protein
MTVQNTLRKVELPHSTRAYSTVCPQGLATDLL